MYERVNVNCARENSTGDWESGILNFIFQGKVFKYFDFFLRTFYDKIKTGKEVGQWLQDVHF